MDVKKIAKLSHLILTPAEEIELGGQLSQTAAYVEVLNQLDTSKAEPTSQVNHQKNVLRSDEVTSSLSQSQALSMTSNKNQGFFVTSVTINKNQ